ncbi:hypothetical protein ATCC90586_007108 [Pythium insidiosum]|nr:hypothetical protein ATCC90586_007108 [Pythium insidiosum]
MPESAASKTAPDDASKPKVLCLDGLRGLAALLVVAHHANFFSKLDVGSPGARTLLAREAAAPYWIAALTEYALRRFLRVYPLFVLVVLVIANGTADQQERLYLLHPNKIDVWKALTFDVDHRYHVLWTLPIEISYYFLLPFHVLAHALAGSRWWMLWAPLAVWTIHRERTTDHTSHRLLWPHVSTFVAGTLAALAFNRLQDTIKLSKIVFTLWHRLALRSTAAASTAVLLSSVFRGLFYHWVLHWSTDDKHSKGSGVPCVSLPLAVIIVCELLLPGPISSSGAGKTTLMDVIAGRKTGGKIRGQILLNGHEATDLAIRRCTGYCEQMDIYSEASMIREALTFSAFLRQGSDVPDSQKYDSVEECLELLDLHPIADQIIRGSLVEQMKRFTIGVELAAQPSVLFLDEPTSGLDARSAKMIITNTNTNGGATSSGTINSNVNQNSGGAAPGAPGASATGCVGGSANCGGASGTTTNGASGGAQVTPGTSFGFNTGRAMSTLANTISNGMASYMSSGGGAGAFRGYRD